MCSVTVRGTKACSKPNVLEKTEPSEKIAIKEHELPVFCWLIRVWNMCACELMFADLRFIDKLAWVFLFCILQ